MTEAFTTNCTRCDRLSEFLTDLRRLHPEYYNRPVPSFGDANARLLIVGLAPGMHGANATGRPFTGDHAGVLLYATLHAHGFANQPEGVAIDDGLQLIDCRITNAVRCLPPQNKPVASEVNNCNDFLAAEIASLPANGVVVTLGGLAHAAVLRTLKLRKVDFPFGHMTDYGLPDGKRLLSSYHCSRYNTQTRRLTPKMFSEVFAIARQHLDSLQRQAS